LHMGEEEMKKKFSSRGEKRSEGSGGGEGKRYSYVGGKGGKWKREKSARAKGKEKILFKGGRGGILAKKLWDKGEQTGEKENRGERDGQAKTK